MKVLNSPFPCSISFSADTGVIPCATAHYQKRLSDLRGFYLDPDAKPKEAACPRVTASWDKTARVWDAATGKPVGKPIFVPHACTITRSRDEEGAGHLRHRSSAARPLRHCVNAERERCQAKSKCKRLITESFRFLLEREPNTSILRSFHITDISRYFPNTNVEIRRRLTRWASTRPTVPGIMTRTSFALTPLP